MTLLPTSQPDVIALATSDGRHSGYAMPVEAGRSEAPAEDTVNVVEAGTSTIAELPAHRPWRPRGVRAGRRHKKRYGVSLAVVRSDGWAELSKNKASS